MTIKSAQVVSGTPILAAGINTIRDDALYLGGDVANAVALAVALRRYSRDFNLSINGTTKVQCVFDDKKPPTLMLNGYLLQAAATVISAADSGGAGARYVFAQRTASSTTFTLVISASAVEGADQRLVASYNWNGTSIDAATIVLQDVSTGGGMKRVTSTGYQIIPAAIGQGVVVGGAAGAFGAWTQLIAATANASYIVGILLQEGNVSSRTYAQAQIGIGAAAAEVAISETRFGNFPTTNSSEFRELMFPVLVNAGTRLSARIADSAGNSFKVSLMVVETANVIDL